MTDVASVPPKHCPAVSKWIAFFFPTPSFLHLAKGVWFLWMHSASCSCLAVFGLAVCLTTATCWFKY